MFDLNALGFTKEELQERVIVRICDELLTSAYFNNDSDTEEVAASSFKRELDKRIKDRIDLTISAIAEKHLLPNVTSFIEGLILQETNAWGEKTGAPVTFIEYLTKRAEAYMHEQVNSNGKAKVESGDYSWRGTQSRLTYLVNSHLHYSIEAAMKNALQIANGAIATGIQETVKTKLAEISASLKVGVTAK